MTELVEYIKNYPTDKLRWFVAKHPHLLQSIKDITHFLPDDAPWNQRLFHIATGSEYPVPCPVCNKQVKWKTDARRYMTYCSTSCSATSANTQSKRVRTNVEKYGVPHYALSEEFKGKAAKTNKQKFGVEYASQSDEFKRAVRKTVLDRYGVATALHINQQERFSKEQLSNHHMFSNISAEVIDRIHDRDWLLDQHITQRKSLTEISNMLNGYDINSLSRRLRVLDIPIKRYMQSAPEKELTSIISSFGLQVIERDRTIINPRELDIYVPSKRVAIEYNGLFWHGENCIPDDLHRNKYLECKRKGIRLVTIFEDEWLERKDIVISKLKHILGVNDSPKIYARKCIVKNVTRKEKVEFFELNHIQGDGPSSINLGLYSNSVLVACVGFMVSGTTATLNRYATSSHVVGGFTRLLAHSIPLLRSIGATKIDTFADLRWSEGDVYTSSGFTIEREITRDYQYVVGKIRVHKFNFRHGGGLKKLKAYDPSLSEHQNMLANNIFRIWDCGKLKFSKLI